MKISNTGNFSFIVPIIGMSTLRKLFSAFYWQKIISNSLIGKVMMGLVLASMICCISVGPAFGRDNNDRNDKGRYEKRGHAYGHNKPVYRPYGYYGNRERVYYPPPRVVYAPPPPPGVSIFFPPIFIPGR